MLSFMSQIQEDLSKLVEISPPMVSVSVTTMKETAQALERMKDSDSLRYRTQTSYPSIKLGVYRRLDGIKDIGVIEVGDGSIIKLFDKTPFPRNSTDVVCPHFLEFKWANGCNFNCSWCYLNGTLRFRPMGKKPYLKDKQKIIEHLITFLRDVDSPYLLNSGELSDSLVFEGNDFSLSKNIIPLFKKQNRHKLLILTKSANVSGLLEANAQNHVIASFSLNPVSVAKRWEKRAPSPLIRIDAAKKLFDAGYRVRIRIDPIVPIHNWEKEYGELINSIFREFTPERITIGSLRGLQSTINNSSDTSWTKYLDETSNWGKKINLKTRVKMYSFMLNTLKDKYSYGSVALCKETIEVWRALSMDYREIKCNCLM
jgi:spore photoproduct lyase